MECIFCKIVEGKIPADKILETPSLLAFLDIKPIHPGHALLIPKTHYQNLFDLPENLLAEMGVEIKRLAQMIKMATGAEGVNIGMNNLAAAGQLVPHAHFHIIPRFTNDGYEHWKGKDVTQEELKKMATKMKGAKVIS